MEDRAPKATRLKRTRQQRRVSVTHQELLDAARTIFVGKGLDLCTIDVITEQADLGKGTFYCHFKNKAGVITLLMTQVMGKLAASIESRCRDIKECPVLLNTIIEDNIEKSLRGALVASLTRFISEALPPGRAPVAWRLKSL